MADAFDAVPVRFPTNPPVAVIIGDPPFRANHVFHPIPVLLRMPASFRKYIIPVTSTALIKLDVPITVKFPNVGELVVSNA